jgi:hypothetical protein
MKYKNTFITTGILAAFIAIALFSSSSCGIYRFTDAAIPDSIKTIKVNLLENRASYVNPSLSPQLTDKLRQKILSQTSCRKPITTMRIGRSVEPLLSIHSVHRPLPVNRLPIIA